jgi:hypothetical protein
MSVRILRDVEEAISREVRRITFHEDRTLDFTVLQDTFHPITGEIVKTPIEPNFYDSSADAQHIQYPHFFIKLLKMKEDLTTGRVTPQYGKQCGRPVLTSPKGYSVVIYGQDGLINPVGNILTTSIFQIRKAQVGFLLRLLSGNNIGTYTITAVTVSNIGQHTITVSNDLVTALPAIGFDTVTRIVGFTEIPDLNTVKIGDEFIDSLSVSWPITAVDVNSSTIEIGGTGNPSLALGGKITRIGDVFQAADLSSIKYSVMDPSKPLQISFGAEAYSSGQLYDHEIPLDIYYLIRIDSKERANHIDIANRMWEEFNPPRTSLPVIIRTKLSAEQKLTQDVTSGGSSTIYVADNSNFTVGELVYIFDDFHPTKDAHGNGFEEVFDASIVGKTGIDQLILSKTVPDTFLASNNTKVVSHANYNLCMFHFVDHVTKDVEEAQYWSHEFTFWIQVWIDRQGLPTDYSGVVQKIVTIPEDLDGNVII